MNRNNNMNSKPLSSFCTSQDSRLIDAARAATMLLEQRETEFIDPYTTCDPLFPSLIHDILMLAKFLGYNPDEVISEGRRWFKDSENDTWKIRSENADWSESRQRNAIACLAEFHKLYHEGQDRTHLMACMGNLADIKKR